MMRSPFAGSSRKPNHLRDASGFLPASAEVLYLRQVAGDDTVELEVIVAELVDEQSEEKRP